MSQLRVNLQNYKVLFLAVTAVLALLVASPALQRLLMLPPTEFFSELSLLGSGHLATNYPFNITRNEYYNVFLGIGNNLGDCTYYQVQVKFRNETQPAADSFDRTPSSLPSLYNLTVFVANKEKWELPVVFSFDYEYFENLSQISFSRIIFNGLELNLHDYSAAWNSLKNEFSGTLFLELWIYNSTVSRFQYHERFVSLHLNMTVS
jgi:hypothetical protein